MIFQNGREHCKHEQRSASYHLSLLQLIAEWPWCLFSWQTYQYVSIRFKKTRNRFSKVSACDPQPSSSSAPLRAFRLFPDSCMSCHVLGQGTLPKTMHSQKENKQNQNKKDEKNMNQYIIILLAPPHIRTSMIRRGPILTSSSGIF